MNLLGFDGIWLLLLGGEADGTMSIDGANDWSTHDGGSMDSGAHGGGGDVRTPRAPGIGGAPTPGGPMEPRYHKTMIRDTNSGVSIGCFFSKGHRLNII